jgi:hypothetical protein
VRISAEGATPDEVAAIALALDLIYAQPRHADPCQPRSRRRVAPLGDDYDAARDSRRWRGAERSPELRTSR